MWCYIIKYKECIRNPVFCEGILEKFQSVKSKIPWFFLFFAIILKNAYYLFEYLPVADDNNSYGIYRLSSNIIQDVILHYNLHTVRPALALMDSYIWSKLWNCLGIAFFIITIIHFLSCILLYKIFELLDLNMGIIAIAIFALLPLGSDATYWLSASTRIIVGLFFILLSFYLLCLYLKRDSDKKKIHFILFLVVHLLSLCFYEQLIALSFVSLILIAVFKWKASKKKWVLVLPFLNFIIITAWYAYFGDKGNVAARGQIVKEQIFTHIVQAAHVILKLWKKNIAAFLNNDLSETFRIIAQDRAYIFVILALLVCLIIPFAFYYNKPKGRIKENAVKLGIGLVLFIAPYIPFFVLNSLYIRNRNLFLSFIGLGLMCEAVVNMILSGNKKLEILKKSLTGLVVFVLLISNVYELNYYKNIGTIDREITSGIFKTSSASDYFNGSKSLILFDTKPNYVSNNGLRVNNCTIGIWTLTGALEGQNGINRLKLAYPVRDNTATLLDAETFGTSVLLGIDDDFNITPLTATKASENKYSLLNPDGSEFGRLERTDGKHVIFHLTKTAP